VLAEVARWATEDVSVAERDSCEAGSM